MSSPAEEVKERLSIVDVVASYVKLQKAGRNFKARCPFHNEKTPSFVVSPERGTYHCFGCNRGGDIFSFVEEIEGSSFSEALRMLAERAGVTLRKANKSEEDTRARLYALMEDATVFYQKTLIAHKDALSYLYERGLTRETLKTFRVGFAKDSWSALIEHLRGKGYTPEEIERAGLAIKKEAPSHGTTHYDRFRSRIMFPIADARGRIVAFSGRMFGEGEGGKYINNPGTPLYDKSRIVVGYDKAKQAMREKNACVIVEGVMDLIMAHQAGTTHTVAVTGTALTEAHMELIHRLADTAILAFDGDQAGIAAARKAGDIGLAQGLSVRAVRIPGGADPADLVREDPKKWEKLLAEAPSIISFLLDTCSEGRDRAAFRVCVSAEILPLVKRVGNKITRESLIEEIAQAIAVPKEAVREEVDKAAFLTESASSEHAPPPAKRAGSRRVMLEEQVVGLLLWLGGPGGGGAGAKGEEEARIDVSPYRTEFESICGHAALARWDEHPRREELIFKTERAFTSHEHPLDELRDLMRFLKKEVLKEELAMRTEELKHAAARGDKKKEQELLAQCSALGKQLYDIDT